MDKYLEIIADVKAKLEEIANVGKVYDYERRANTDAEFIALFKDASGKILGWEITRKTVTEHIGGAYFRHHQLLLQGYRGLQDGIGSSKDFQVLVDTICTKFRGAQSPGGSTWDYRDGDNPNNAPAQVPVIDDRMFGNVLCHYAQITLAVTERILP